MGVERQRFQSAANLERMLVITAFLAVRLLQLLGAPDDDAQASCDTRLSEDEWNVLWGSTHFDGAIWRSRSWVDLLTPSTLDVLDGTRWDTMWHGWFRLPERLEG